MFEIDASALGLGFIVGLPMALLFFWGLNWGMRVALASEHPGRVLLLSFFCRLVMLLGVGLALTKVLQSLWPLAGYMAAFLVVRIVAVMRAQLNRKALLAQQEGV